MNELPFHPLADLFPLIEGAEFDELVASIKENGLREAVVTFEGSILDGRNRYRACRAAGVSPMVQPFTGRDPVRFVIDKNINRRHLTVSQRAMIAAKFATFKQGDSFSQRAEMAREIGDIGNPISVLTVDQAADLMHVNHGAVTDARRVLSEGTPEEVEAVQAGEASVTTIAKGIRAKKTPAERKRNRNGHSDAKAAQIQNLKMRGKIWTDLREALERLSGLPIPEDVLSIIREGSGKGDIVDHYLSQSLEWLTNFATVWKRDHDRDDRKAAA